MTIKNDAAAAAARRAAEEAARKRAAEAAAKAAAEAAAKAAAKKAAETAARRLTDASTRKGDLSKRAGQQPSASAVRQSFGHDELSKGLGQALRQRAANALGGGAPVFRAAVADVAPTATTSQAQTPVEVSTQRVQEATARSPVEGARVLEEEAKRLGDPAQVDALVAAVQPQLETISRSLADRVKNRTNEDDHVTRDTLTALAHVTDLAGQNGANTIASKLAVAIGDAVPVDGNQDLYKFDDVLRDLAGDGEGVTLSTLVAQKVTREEGLGKAGNELLDVSTKGVQKLNDQFKDAKSAYAAQEQRLASDLAAFGPALTEQQRTDYVAAFWNDPDHKPAKDALEAADARLASTFTRAHAALESTAAAGDDDSAKVLLDSLELMAQSPTHADDALRYVGELNASGNTELLNALGEFSDGDLQTRLEDKVVAPALALAQGEAMAAVSDGDAGALQRLEADLAVFKTNGKNFMRLSQAVGGLSDTLAALRQNPTGFRVDSLINGFNDKGPLGKALAVFGVVSAISAAGNDGPALDRIQAQLGAVRGGVQLGIGILNTVARGTALAADAAKFGAKFLPAVGLAIDSIEFGQGINELLDDPNAGEFLKVIGSGISIVGDLAGLVPVLGTLPDALLTAVGAVVSGIGGLVDGLIEGSERAEELANERRELLEAAHIPEATRDLLMNVGLAVGSQLGTLGLTRTEVLQELRKFEANDGIDSFVAIRACGALGLQGEEAITFMENFRKIAGEHEGSAEQLDFFLGQLSAHIAAFDLDQRNGFEHSAEERNELLRTDLQILMVQAGPFADLMRDAGLADQRPEDVNISLFLAN